MAARKPPPGLPRRCGRCRRFCSWRLLRYAWRTSCCYDEAPAERGPVVVEIVRELEINGERFAVAIRRG